MFLFILVKNIRGECTREIKKSMYPLKIFFNAVVARFYLHVLCSVGQTVFILKFC